MTQRSVQTISGLDDALLSCGQRGVHLLFDPPVIHRAFARIADGLVAERGLWAAHDAWRTLAELDDLIWMRRYLRTLAPSTVDLLVYLYFRRLDQRLRAAGPTLH